MESHMLNTGRRVKNSRKSRGWSAARLASEAGVAPNTVSSIENGKTVRDGNLRKVLDVLGIEPEVSESKVYPDDIDLLLHFVGEYLEQVPLGERREIGDAITRLLATHRYGPSAVRPTPGE